jgi:hypothetical protein
MKNTLKWLSIVVAGGTLGFIMLVAVVIVTGARPWHTYPNPDPTAAAGATQIFPMVAEVHAQETSEEMMHGGMAMEQGMMQGETAMEQGMMSGRMGMMAQHQETAKLLDHVVASFAAIEAEKDPAALKTKLTEHGALLKQLQSKSQESMSMMGKMQEHMKTCPMMIGGMMSSETSK